MRKGEKVAVKGLEDVVFVDGGGSGVGGAVGAEGRGFRYRRVGVSM